MPPRKTPDELNFELIRRVQNRPFIFDVSDEGHKDKHLIGVAWSEIAVDIGHGKNGDDKWCKEAWKNLRDYYNKQKRLTKGKSGQARQRKTPWKFMSALSFLDNFAAENEFTIDSMSKEHDSVANLEDDHGHEEPIGEELVESYPMTPSANEEPERSNLSTDKSTSSHPASDQSTPTQSTSSLTTAVPIAPAGVKRKSSLANQQMDFNKKVLKFLEVGQSQEDEIHHFTMWIGTKLRKMTPEAADWYQQKFSELILKKSSPFE